MALLEIKWKPSPRELKQFAAIWIGFFALIGISCLVRKGLTPAVVLWLVAGVGFLEFVRPGFMRPIYVLWMALALPIGWTVSHLLLLAVYYLVLTPIGLIMRLLRHDPLERRFDRLAKSYWTPHDPSAQPSRYFKQF
jgi:Saxitoxin biosynthesis operon protein SxtJ